MRTKGSWAYPLQSALHFPVTGGLHPLRREAVRRLTWSNGFVLFVVAAIFVTYVGSLREEDETAAKPKIVISPEISNPPSIKPPSRPRVTTPSIATPPIGTPEPVPEALAEHPTVASLNEISEFLRSITSEELDGRIFAVPNSPEKADVYHPTLDEIPIRLSIDPPRYPELAREAGMEGIVIIMALVGKDGRVKKTVLVSGGPEMLVIAAIRCAETAVFRPALTQNKPVEVWVKIPIVFKLNGQ